MANPQWTHERLRKRAITVLRRGTSAIRGGQWNTHQVGFNCSIILSEIVSAANDIPDAIGWSYGNSVLIECKTSRADLFADSQKPQLKSGTGAGERRFFMTPKGLVKPEELPPEWGLLEVEGSSVWYALDCQKRTLDLAGHVSEKRMLLSTIGRIKMREFLIIERFEDHFESVSQLREEQYGVD